MQRIKGRYPSAPSAGEAPLRAPECLQYRTAFASDPVVSEGNGRVNFWGNKPQKRSRGADNRLCGAGFRTRKKHEPAAWNGLGNEGETRFLLPASRGQRAGLECHISSQPM